MIRINDMGLLTNKRYPRIARKDIKVKKLLLRNKLTGEMCTPIQLFPVSRELEILRPEKKTTFLQILCGKHRDKPAFYHSYKYAYGEGFIHSYDLNTSIEPEGSEFFLEAIIPKGTLYYFNSEDCEYCSTKLKLIWPKEDRKQIEN